MSVFTANPPQKLYINARSKSGMSRERAAEKLFMAPKTLEKIEKGRSEASPKTALDMQRVYKQPGLTAHYCSKICPIGQVFAYEIEEKDLTAAVLGLLKEFNDVKEMKNRLIAIASNGRVNDEEEADFKLILKELLDLERKIEKVKLWAGKSMCMESFIKEYKVQVVR